MFFALKIYFVNVVKKEKINVFFLNMFTSSNQVESHFCTIFVAFRISWRLSWPLFDLVLKLFPVKMYAHEMPWREATHPISENVDLKGNFARHIQTLDNLGVFQGVKEQP